MPCLSSHIVEHEPKHDCTVMLVRFHTLFTLLTIYVHTVTFSQAFCITTLDASSHRGKSVGTRLFVLFHDSEGVLKNRKRL